MAVKAVCEGTRERRPAGGPSREGCSRRMGEQSGTDRWEKRTRPVGSKKKHENDWSRAHGGRERKTATVQKR